MGQAQSAVKVEGRSDPTAPPPPPTAPPPPPPSSTEKSEQPSLDSLIAEAAAYGNENENQSLEEKAQKALDCPCIAHLRSGPCGTQFSTAFVCFLKSTAEEKGSDCVNPFIALQNCIKVNPQAFSKDVLEDEEDIKKEEVSNKNYNIRPPLWSEDSKSKKS